ncbi:MAG: hypothetical protein ACTJHT_02690 [Sphingobacterium sp.]
MKIMFKVNNIVYKVVAVIALLIGFYACEEDDAEPKLDVKKFSRLYVSFEAFNSSNAGVSDTNIRIIYPADSSEFKYSLGNVSEARGGGVIYFNPFLKGLFQASANLPGLVDTAVYIMNVGEKTGILSNTGAIRNELLSNVRGLAYNRGYDEMYIVNSSSGNPGIYVVDRPKTRSQPQTRPLKKLNAPGIEMWGAAYNSGEDRLYTSKLGQDAAIYVFKDLSTIVPSTVDSTARIDPFQTLSIADASNLRGLFFDSVKNVLAITDFGDGTTEGTGRILVFDNFTNTVGTDGNHAITPSRIITGAATGLTQPVDVAIDTRETGVYLYAADRQAKKVFRFMLSDDGNVEPDKVLQTGSQIPVGLALDTRDDSTLPQ